MRIAYYCLLILTLSATSHAAGIRTVVLAGNDAPGTDTTFFAFENSPQINNRGEVAFASILLSADTGLWRDSPGSGLSPIASSDSSVPGAIPGVNFENFGEFILNNEGQIAFKADLIGQDITSFNDRGIWSQANGDTLGLVARSDSTPPGTGTGITFNDFPELRFNDNGETAFIGNTFGTSFHTSGVWSEGNGGGLSLVAREGEQAPGVASGQVFANAGLRLDLSFNDNGHVAFPAFLEGPGTDGTNNMGIWSEESSNGLTLVARKDQTLDTFLGHVRSNNNDQVTFVKQIVSPRTLFKGDSNGLTTVSSSGAPAPGTNENIISFFYPTVINGDNQLAFFSSLSGPGNRGGVWSEGGGNGLQLVALQGDQAPGVELGSVFLSFQENAVLGLSFAPVLNGNGQTAFMAILSGSGINNSNDIGIWAEDDSGSLNLIARKGDTIDVSNGLGTDLRTVQNLNFVRETGNEDGRASGFNDLGQLVFQATFTDGSQGIFVSNSVALSAAYGDFDADGDVDGADFLTWQRDNGTSAGLTAWQNNYGTVTSPISGATQIPEPTMLTLTMLAICCLNGFRRKLACQNITV